MLEYIVSHVASAAVPVGLYLVYLWRRDRNRKLRQSEFENLPHPKNSPSDFIIYRYWNGAVDKRWVCAVEEDALTVMKNEERDGELVRMFKDGKLLEEGW